MMIIIIITYTSLSHHEIEIQSWQRSQIIDNTVKSSRMSQKLILKYSHYSINLILAQIIWHTQRVWAETMLVTCWSQADRELRNKPSMSAKRTKLKYQTYVNAASPRLSASALRSVLSRSMTPHDACSTESSRQSPAVRFHRA